jgi:hypothetical protein
MDLADVVDELRAALDTIPDLKVPEWGAQRVTAPAALVMPPERIVFDETYGRGVDRYPDVEVLVLIANPTSWQAFRELAPYVNGSGPRSVKAALEAFEYTACDGDALQVSEADFDVVAYSGVQYLAAIFHLNIPGKGA